MRKHGGQFTVNAESVQGNPDATATFKPLKVGTMRRIQAGDMRDAELLRDHLVDWTGFVDDNDESLPSPADEPGIFDALYVEEQRELVRMFLLGPDEDDAKN